MSDRPYGYPDKPGRLDLNGVEWWACDPYPTWFRWDNEVLCTHYSRGLQYVEDFPGWADERDLRHDLYVEKACEVMHDAYEKAAVGAGWETNPASRKPWADVPETNKTTMRAAVAALLEWIQ